MTFHIVGPRRHTQCFWELDNFSNRSCGNSAIRTWFCDYQQYLCLFHIVFACNPSKHDQGIDVGSPKSSSLWSTFHVGSIFCFFQFSLMSSTYTDKNNPLSRCTNKTFPIRNFFPILCLNRIFSNCLSHNGPAKGWPYRFRSRGTTGSYMLDHDLDHLCLGRRIHISGHSDFGIFSNFVSIIQCNWSVSRYCASCLSCATR